MFYVKVFFLLWARHCQASYPVLGQVFPGQGKVREFSGWPGLFGKILKSQGKDREFENL